MNIGMRATIGLLVAFIVAGTLITATFALGGPRLSGDYERMVTANSPLFVPDVGKTNVYCKGGVAPMAPFTKNGCKPVATSGSFDGSFLKGTPDTTSRDQGNIERSRGQGAKADFTATFMNPIDGKEYRIVSRDTKWNSSTTAEPTPDPFFARPFDNVFYDQTQHGQTMIDRSDAPLLFVRVGMYGHVDVFQGGNMVAKDIFTHVMVGYVLGGPDDFGRNEFFTHYKITPQSPLLVFIFIVNTPGTIKATPPPTDPSLHQGPALDHDDMSSPWPTDDPTQPLYFNFLIYQQATLNIKQ